MSFDYKSLERIIENPSEGFESKLKSWLDPKLPEYQAKIIKACIALYNNDGGYLIIGFNDDGTPIHDNFPSENIHKLFEPEEIQQNLISKYSSYKF